MIPGTNRTVLLIMGMRDNLCRERLAAVLEAIPGVRDVDVNLHRARATILHEQPCAPGDLVWAVVQSGFGAALASGDERDSQTGSSGGKENGRSGR